MTVRRQLGGDAVHAEEAQPPPNPCKYAPPDGCGCPSHAWQGVLGGAS